MASDFAWDPWKALINERKHRVSFHEAMSAFKDPFSVTVDDRTHSTPVESRWLLIGISDRGRLIVVVHADDGDTVRIISARHATPAERHDYEEA